MVYCVFGNLYFIQSNQFIEALCHLRVGPLGFSLSMISKEKTAAFFSYKCHYVWTAALSIGNEKNDYKYKNS